VISMSIQLLNTLSKKKETLQPLNDNTVSMYCCGVTPYSNTHIGHTRTFFSYDLLHRTLVDNGYVVHWARNITDVDDKIINRANAEHISCEELVSRYVIEQNETLEKFHLQRPEFEPKVTENILQIINLIEILIQKNDAYTTNSGVYFRVRNFKDYGKLSKNKIDALKQGARIEVDETKEDALDFALWKLTKPGEIFWDSPWGAGRPGWHVECSAMIHSLFGDSIDIHMGGRDLIFPHHEAEIAQSEAATGKPLANLWLHAGMVTLYGEKMSKSTNHYVGIRDFLTKYPSEVLRLVFLSVAYAQPLDFTFELATENFKKLAKIYRFVSLLDIYERQTDAFSEGKVEFSEDVFLKLEGLIEHMRQHVRDDLNSTAALAVFFEFIKETNSKIAKMEKAQARLSKADVHRLKVQWPQFKKWISCSLGLLEQTPQDFFAGLSAYNLGGEISAKEIEAKIMQRNEARQNKDWKQSDVLRDELLGHGIQIQDTPSGTRWTVVI